MISRLTKDTLPLDEPFILNGIEISPGDVILYRNEEPRPDEEYYTSVMTIWGALTMNGFLFDPREYVYEYTILKRESLSERNSEP